MKPQDYSKRYHALNVKRRKYFLKQLKYWFEWSYTTFYVKIKGDSLTRIERTAIESLLTQIEHKDGIQTEMSFSFDTHHGAVFSF